MTFVIFLPSFLRRDIIIVGRVSSYISWGDGGGDGGPINYRICYHVIFVILKLVVRICQSTCFFVFVLNEPHKAVYMSST